MVEFKPFSKFGVWFPIVGTAVTLLIATVVYIVGYIFLGFGQDPVVLNLIGVLLYILWGLWGLLGWGLSKTKLRTVFSLQKIKPRLIFLTVVIAILAQFVIILISTFAPTILGQELKGNATDLITPETSTLVLVLTILTATVFAPIFEEILFRALFFDGIYNTAKKVKAKEKTAITLAIIISSLLFGLAHVISFDINGVFIYIITGLFGAYLAWLRVKTQSLTLSIISHTTFNSVTMVLLVIAI